MTTGAAGEGSGENQGKYWKGIKELIFSVAFSSFPFRLWLFFMLNVSEVNCVEVCGRCCSVLKGKLYEVI